MLTAAEVIADWEAAGNLAATLVIRKADLLPPLPAGLTRLYCGDCTGLVSLPALPSTLTHLSCYGCPGLTSLPALPAALTSLCCDDCAGLTSLPALPAALTNLVCIDCPGLASLPALSLALTHLYCNNWTAIPDACPPALLYRGGAPVDRRHWRQQVAEQHARQRSAVAAVLPPFALLYV